MHGVPEQDNRCIADRKRYSISISWCNLTNAPKVCYSPMLLCPSSCRLPSDDPCLPGLAHASWNTSQAADGFELNWVITCFAFGDLLLCVSCCSCCPCCQPCCSCCCSWCCNCCLRWLSYFFSGCCMAGPQSGREYNTMRGEDANRFRKNLGV